MHEGGGRVAQIDEKGVSDERHETRERMEGAKGTGEASAEKQAKLARSESARAQGSKERQKQQNPEWTEGSRTVYFVNFE